MAQIKNDQFFDTLPVFVEFGGVADMSNYKPLPDDWILATADIVQSTLAIEEGRYKEVNVAGASVISAVLNALGKHDYPFIFGGDGAVVALPASGSDKARLALSAVQTWVADVLDLNLRVAMVPVSEIRSAGFDVSIGRHKVGPDVAYAMFAGGGASWAEAQMKAGRYRLLPAPHGTMPDLSGLSCRWDPIENRHGEIVSIIAVPAGSSDHQFQTFVTDLIALTSEQGRGAHPLPLEGPKIGFTTRGLAIEARATAPKGRQLKRKISILWEICIALTLDRLGLTVGGFDPKRYKSEVAQNSDFRKFDDGLKMTVDVDKERGRRIEALLEDASVSGICHYGLHRQQSALMTCLVPTPLARNHMHFIDGAAGGYAMAAKQLKEKYSSIDR